MLLGTQGKIKEAAALYTTLYEVQHRVLGPENRDTLATAMQLAGTALLLGEPAAAEGQYREVLALQVKVLGKLHPSTLVSSMNLGSALLNQAKYTEAEQVYTDNLVRWGKNT